MKPLRDNIVVKQVAKENKTESGIVLTSSISGPSKASVEMVGPDVGESIAVGNLVLVNWGAAKDIGDGLWILSAKEVYLVY